MLAFWFGALGLVNVAGALRHPSFDQNLWWVDNTVAMFRERGIRRVLVVSHFYHLPRIELAYERAGSEVYTVPARFTFVWQTPFIVGREVPAFWSYYLRALLD